MTRAADRPPPDKEGVCYGCEKPFAKGTFRRFAAAAVDIAPGVAVHVCGKYAQTFGSYGQYDARAECLRRALDRARACPGCGERMSRSYGMCHGCRDALRVGREALAADGGREWFAVVPDLLEQPSGEYRGPPSALPRMLLELLGATDERPHEWLGDRTIPMEEDARSGRYAAMYVQLPRRQAEALLRFRNALCGAFDRAYAAGQRSGRSLLLQLARGQATTREYDDAAARAEKHEAELEAGRAARNTFTAASGNDDDDTESDE